MVRYAAQITTSQMSRASRLTFQEVEMRMFVAGATGTLGRPVVRALVSRGHDVIGLTRTQEGARRIKDMGARAVVGNALDAERLKALVVEARPDVVVHLLTALPPGGVTRKSQLRQTNELRTAGTANLIAASLAGGAHRIVAESFVGVYSGGSFSRPVSEDAPLPPPPEGPFRDTVLALRSLEDQLRAATASSGIETVALRIGFLYGSDVPSTRLMIDQARAGRLFLPAGLSGIAPFVHNDDAAAAIVAAIERPNVS
ncbi:MAG: NAD(P)-dependent oxidoreductase, partial [Acidobacteria bacterium]